MSFTTYKTETLEKNKINLRTKIAVAAALSTLILLFSGGSAQAQAVDSAPTAAEESYTYTVQECDTLTHLARRTIQLHDNSNNEIDLNDAAVIYAESILVTSYGARHLNVGETIAFSSSAVSSALDKASMLGTDMSAGWQAYANNVNFDTSAITPISTPAGVEVPEGPIANSEETNNDEDNEAQGEDEVATAPEQSATEADDSDTSSSSNTPWYWWVGGAVAVGGVWYLLWNRVEDDEDEE